MSKSRLSKDEAIMKIAEAVARRPNILAEVPGWLYESCPRSELDFVVGASCIGNGRFVHMFKLIIGHVGAVEEVHHFHPQPTTLEIMNASTRRKAKRR